MEHRSGNSQKSSSSLRIKRSSILILTLWVLAFLAFFGLYLNRGVRQKLSLVKTLNFRGTLHYIADAGIKRAVIELLKDETTFDTIRDNWSDNPAVFEQIPVGLGDASVHYRFESSDGRAEERYGISDEERKININTANPAVIERLFKLVASLDETKAQELAAAIVDWRDSDSSLSIPLGSAEDAYYDDAPEPYNCKDSSFEVLEELLLVKGMSQSLYDTVAGFLTVHGAGSVNINTASEQVLAALDIEERVVEEILKFRAGEDEVWGSADDDFFEAPDSIVADLSQKASLSVSEIANISNIVSAGLLGTRASAFMVQSRAQVGALKKEIICVVNKSGKILSWREL